MFVCVLLTENVIGPSLLFVGHGCIMHHTALINIQKCAGLVLGQPVKFINSGHQKVRILMWYYWPVLR